MRSLLFNHIVADVKNVNKKHANNKINSKLQGFMYTMLRDNHLMAARMSLNVMTTLYRKQVWCDAKTVNVVATAILSKHVKLCMTGIRFFLGVDQHAEEEADSDAEEDARLMQAVAKDAFNIHHKNTAASSKKVRKYKRALKTVKANEKKERTQGLSTSSALMLLHDPQGLAEKVFARLKASTDSFEVKLSMMNFISRLIGTHELLLLNFYPFLQRYLNPHQQEITAILAFMTQAVHNLVPPESLEPVVQTLANHFVNDRSSNEAMSIGINTIREVCSRQPLTMSQELLHDLSQYRTTKDKGVAIAARSLIGLFREIRPELLQKKDRGKKGQTNLDAKPMEYGAQVVNDEIDGLRLLREYEAKGKEVPDEDEIYVQVSRRMNESGDESDAEGEEDVETGDENMIMLGDDDDEENEDEAMEEEEEEVEDYSTLELSEVRKMLNERMLDSKGNRETLVARLQESDANFRQLLKQEQEEASEGEEGEEEDEEEEEEEQNSSTQKGDDDLRILTDEDFEKIRRLKLMQTMNKAAGSKRKRDDVLGEDGLPVSFVTTDFSEKVLPSTLIGTQSKKKATKENKIDSILQGREGREAFGAKRTPKGGGTTNAVKKRKKINSMVIQSERVRSKATRGGGQKAALKNKLRAQARRGNTKRRSK